MDMKKLRSLVFNKQLDAPRLYERDYRTVRHYNDTASVVASYEKELARVRNDYRQYRSSYLSAPSEERHLVEMLNEITETKNYTCELGPASWCED